MISGSSIACPFFVLLSYDGLSRKLILFKSFTAGLSVQEFDDIYNKEISRKYAKHEIQRLSSPPKERIGNDLLVQENSSNWIRGIDF
jgi:hypothetical protein